MAVDAKPLVTGRLGFFPSAVVAPDLPTPTLPGRQLAPLLQPGHRAPLLSTHPRGTCGLRLCRVIGQTQACRRQNSAEPLLPEGLIPRLWRLGRDGRRGGGESHLVSDAWTSFVSGELRQAGGWRRGEGCFLCAAPGPRTCLPGGSGVAAARVSQAT